MKVPISETGTAIVGIKVERQSPRKMKYYKRNKNESFRQRMHYFIYGSILQTSKRRN